MKKLNLSTIGLLQALGVLFYTVLISGFFQLFGNFSAQPSIFFTSVVILALFVFSAAITGSIVFGYPAYLILKKKTKEGLSILAFTLLYLIGMIIIIVILIASLM